MNTLGKASYSKLRGYLKKTGQTTSYGSGSGVDDGGLQIGVPQSYTVLSSGQYSGTTNIALNGKTDAHSNECVFDHVTRLMWSRTQTASVGPSSNGTLPWTTNGSGEGIYTYTAAANAASLAGHNDWRIPNIKSMFDLANLEAPTAVPNTTAWPTLSAVTAFWSSTTIPFNAANAYQISNLGVFGLGGAAKTATALILLVRGPL